MALEITWLGRTCFRMRGREGVVVCDPCPPSSGYKIGKLEANVVTLSLRDDPGFSHIDAMKGEYTRLDAPGEYEVGGILVTGIAVKRGDEGRAVAFIVELDGIRIATLGAGAEKIAEAERNLLEGVDILLLPVGGHGTLPPAVAADLMTGLDPRIAVPMLYKNEIETGEYEPLERFLKETGAKPTPQTKLNVTRSQLPGQLSVVVLEPKV
ncbi:MAG: MBL fold metallo-hydrolase [Dehalococcoidia bacterium]